MSGDADKKIILLAVDASEHAERAFQHYCQHLHRDHHHVVLFHSAEYPQLTAGDRVAPDLLESQIARKEREMKTLEEYYKDILKSRNISCSTKFIFHDHNPGESIVRVSHDVNASLVIVGARGAGTLRRTILGSTSDYVIKHVKLAVLVCPPPKGHDKLHYDHSEEEQHHHHHHGGFLGKIFHPHHHESKDAKDVKEPEEK